MSLSDLDQAWLEAEQLNQYERESAEQAKQHKAEFKLRWPKHCVACGGWGGSSFSQSHPYGSGSATETLFDPCETLDPEICHRCGEAGLSEDAEGPCTFCGWDFNDGIREV